MAIMVNIMICKVAVVEGFFLFMKIICIYFSAILQGEMIKYAEIVSIQPTYGAFCQTGLGWVDNWILFVAPSRKRSINTGL